MTRFKAPRGAPDLYPPTSERVAWVRAVAREIFERYGYRPIQTPVFEETGVFVRTIGESSDIVRKEMYTFADRAERSLTLRPEGTAPVVRAFVEHRLDASLPLPVRLYYDGPMFRYERPQSGRQRQFLQAGVECLGSASPVVDAEVVALGWDVYRAVGLDDVVVRLNSMGCEADRDRFREYVREALAPAADQMCDDCPERLRANPLRVFDCKVPADRQRVAALKTIRDFLCADCRANLETVESLLTSTGVRFEPAPDLVRGFDYYTGVVWEYDLASLGARSAVGGGGRYDGLVADFGGPSLPGVGMAIGIEPVRVALEGRGIEPGDDRAVVFVAWLDSSLAERAATLAHGLRSGDAGRAGWPARSPWRVVLSDEPKSLKAQLRAADRVGARFVVILGPSEAERGVVAVRDFAAQSQQDVGADDLPTYLRERT